MRRFSQKHNLVTLNEINITPLLDLAFVLLIIFVITTPMLEQNLHLTLPAGGVDSPSKLTKEDIKTVEVSKEGFFVMAGQKMTLNEVEDALVKANRINPKMVVYIRVDTSEPFGTVTSLLDRCEKNGISRVNFATKKDRR